MQFHSYDYEYVANGCNVVNKMRVLRAGRPATMYLPSKRVWQKRYDWTIFADVRASASTSTSTTTSTGYLIPIRVRVFTIYIGTRIGKKNYKQTAA